MDADQLHEPLTPDRTPLGLVTGAVQDLMERAIRLEARNAINELGFFPARVARIGVANNSLAYLSILDLNVRFYWLAARDPNSRESELAKSQWTNVADLVQWQLSGLSTGHSQDPRPELLVGADRQARRVMVSIGRAMFVRRDLTQFKALMERLAAIRDD